MTLAGDNYVSRYFPPDTPHNQVITMMRANHMLHTALPAHQMIFREQLPDILRMLITPVFHIHMHMFQAPSNRHPRGFLAA
jgi:hypothetical protein